MSSWWFVWMVVMCVLLVPPVGYGWAYRGWGPPLPRYLQRRRVGDRPLPAPGEVMAVHPHERWGWTGDLVWGIALAGIFWAFTSMWWR